MIEEIAARFPYWATAALIVIGLYGMIAKRSLVKKLIGMNILQSAIILFFIAGSLREGASVPILFEEGAVARAEDFVNPLPHVLMLTAIVVGVAITGVALAFLVRIREEFGTLDEESLLEQVRR
ncbi:MAG: cation:proton antiporter subunit C [Chloroflexi bacterium]|nr:cation:proton antiporter subunit C [Chloroflexota bacterium]